MSDAILKQKVLSFINNKEADVYQKTDRLVKDITTLFHKIKGEMKNKELTEIWVEGEVSKCVLNFRITGYQRVDTDLMSPDEKEKYLITIDRWRSSL